ncbi:MAG: hypothetical protein COY09_01660 [Candidatus Portnoybacteria bacterium CG_4_10_14_0_2_um_filter_39_11]|uniref:Uncharacterized protein n=1 Tax=Candidatus Portnoybacteria bacterium CG_4_10_14_0_2_um_filter_39_11 TaxID=1974797 RepID=A0A2M7UIG4_9BACT|nr:MAG: hypothetical protein AUJ33_01320 [Parcubacteria group bacterium CG1_02_40_25]PIZ71023.1 MAG: hypothetical protein COY09_01660 [Candidatus Portnoybacteria bacterium CG_4_10_14_0_2_um_filter_39_11]
MRNFRLVIDSNLNTKNRENPMFSRLALKSVRLRRDESVFAPVGFGVTKSERWDLPDHSIGHPVE